MADEINVHKDQFVTSDRLNQLRKKGLSVGDIEKR